MEWSVVKNTGYTLVTAAGPEGLEANCECGGTVARTWTTH